MNPDQSGTKPAGSHFPVLAGEDLTGKRSYLVELTHDTGVAEVKLPNAITDDAFFQLEEAAADTEPVDVHPLVNGEERRFVLKGTCNPGDRLCLADTGTAGDKGKVRTIPAGAGTYRPFLIAREAGVDGQHVRAQVYIGLPEVTVAP